MNYKQRLFMRELADLMQKHNVRGEVTQNAAYSSF